MLPGDLFANRFELDRPIGEGGMGVVWRALDRLDGEPIALKVIRRQDDRSIARFQREARVLADLHHPGIARYVAHGATDDGKHYLAMEWLEGESLGARLARGPLGVHDSLALVDRVAGVLAVVHAAGTVHRDLKPDNLLLVGGSLEHVKVLDFGIARPVDVTSALTNTGMLLGTPAYMAPEQVRSMPDIDARADVYALGCLLFECLTARPPFVAEHVMALLAKIVFEDAPRPGDLRPGVPAWVDTLVQLLLAKDRTQRPADAATVTTFLQARGATAGGPPAPQVQALTRSERRLACVVLARVKHSGHDPGRASPSASSPDDQETLQALADATVQLPFPATLLEGLRNAAQSHRARFEVMRDGSVVTILTDARAPTDLTARAARCALSIRELLSDAFVALATGWDELDGTQPLGQVIDRASAQLAASSEEAALPTPRPILLDPTTASLLGPRFEVREDGPHLLLAGEREPLEDVRTLLGRPSPCVGRERELLLLQTTFDECVAESEARAVLVTAEAGVGKSRLRHELARRLTGRGETFELWIARGDPMRLGAPFGMLGQIIRRAARLLDGEPLEARREKLAARVAVNVAEPLRRQVAEFLGEMVGTPFPGDESVLLRPARQDPKLMGDQMLAAWVELARAECRARPLLLVLEDLHWGDRPTVEYVDAALRVLEGERLMVLALARPEVREAFPDLWSKRALTDLRLVGLSRRACEKLVSEALGRIDNEGVARIVDRSGGNAFFLEELVRAAAEGHGGGVPETVLAMMQSRLEGLAPEARRVLRAGSVFGGVFWRGAAGALLGAESDGPNLDACLEELARSELLSRLHESTFQGEVEYAFRHALVRDAAYEMLTEEDRLLGHRLAGAWLADAGETDAMVLATHFERAGELERAIGCYRRAAEQALGGNDYAAAIERAERAVACGAAGEALGEVETVQAEAYRFRGESAAAELHATMAMLALPEGSASWCRAAGAALWASHLVGRGDAVIALARTLCARWSAEAVTGPELGAMAQAALILLYMKGQCEETAALSSRIDASFGRFQHDPTVSAPILRLRTIHAILAGDVGTAWELCEASVRGFEAAGDVRGACGARTNAGHFCNELGAYADAARQLRAALADTGRLGLLFMAAVAKENLGRALLQLGDVDGARALLDDALRSFVASGDRRMEGGTYAYLAEVSRVAGDLARAEAEARRGCELLADVPPLIPCALGVLAGVLLAAGRAAEALETANRAAEVAAPIVAAQGHLEEGESQIYLVRAEALEACGARDAARAAIATARERLLERAARIANPAWRASFLENVPEHARTLALAHRWLTKEPGILR
ncbi:protein kinase domain-containing protein [Sorangium sp. So ce1153]|uniref:serine/threonine-protein kinase n=1 Tax=Sorangium sp. So ce1153 TaxID=3133333 RepID=UPI003F5EB9CE